MPLSWLLDSSDFTPRWVCGNWTLSLGWLHIISDSLIFAAYAAIPAALLVLVLRRRTMPYPELAWLFAAFILLCGMSHLVEVVIFYEPVYRLAGVVKAATALVSLLTAVVLIRALPTILAAPELLRQGAMLKLELASERRRAEELAESQVPLSRRSAELTSRSRRLGEALAAGRAVAVRWSIDSGQLLWEFGLSEVAPHAGLPTGIRPAGWSELLGEPEAARLQQAALLASERSAPLEFEAPLQAAPTARIRLAATPDAIVAGEGRTMTGMFRLL